MPKKDIAVIQLRLGTRERLKPIGKKGESYDDIIAGLLDMAETKGRTPLSSIATASQLP